MHCAIAAQLAAPHGSDNGCFGMITVTVTSYENRWALRSGLSCLSLFARTSANPGSNFFDGGQADLRSGAWSLVL